MDNQNNVPPPLPPDADDVQRVEAEPMEERRYRFGKKASDGVGGAAPGGGGAKAFSFGVNTGAGADGRKPPLIAAWICLAVAWLFLGSKAPFTVFIGVPLDLVALLLGTICLGRGAVTTGAFVLFLGTVGSFIVYLIGLFRFLVTGL